MSRVRDTPFSALSLAILRGFLRDKASVFFALIFPLMFLVLFGGLFSDQTQSKVELVQVGDVAVIDGLPADAREAFDDTFDVRRDDDLDAAIAEVRRGDADVAVEMRGDTLVAHYTQTDQVKAAITQGALQAFVQGSNVGVLATTAGEPPPYGFQAERVEDDSLDTIQFVTPGLLGWAVAMSAAFGAAATIQGWRQSKLLRRLQLAPVSTRTVVGARIMVAIVIAFVQLAVFVALGVGAFGLVLTGSWWMAVPLLVVGTLCFMSVGLFAGAVTTTVEGAVNAANFIVLPMAFLSGSFFPLDGAPAWLRTVSNLLPLKHLNDGMLDVMVRGEGPASALAPLGILAGFALVVTLGLGPALPVGDDLMVGLLQSPRARVRRLGRLVGRVAPSPLAGKVVLVTGASSGIGEATALAVGRAGATVLLVARRADDLERVRAQVEAEGGRASAYPCDLTDLPAVDALVAQVLAEHGVVDYLVNNAGRSIRRSLHLSHDRFHDFERTMAINYFGPVRLTMGLLPAMRAQGFGHVVNVLSWGVQLKAPKFAAYLASKSALDTWARIAGRETWSDNVTFTNMRFGLVSTAMVVPTESFEDRRAMSAEQAAARIVRALEDRPVTWGPVAAYVGEAVSFLAPRLSDALMARYDRMAPDSRAARGEACQPRSSDGAGGPSTRNSTPPGSASTAIRPYGESTGSVTTLPPRSTTVAAATSVSATVT